MKTLALTALIGALVVPAAAASPASRHVTGGLREYSAHFHAVDGCLTRGANLEARRWEVSDGTSEYQLQRTWLFVSVWDDCANRNAFWAVGEFNDAGLEMSDDLRFARLRLQGTMTTSDGGTAPLNLDLQFSPDESAMTATIVDGPNSCWNVDYHCVRRLHARHGHSTGTFNVNGIEFFAPWDGEMQGVGAYGGRTLDASVSCMLPTDADVRDCNLLELP
jgi:hypothetical protein